MSLSLEAASTIDALDAAEWDRCLGPRGSFTANGLRCLERVFHAGNPPENRWRFHYLVVRDTTGRPLAMTVFTDALWKDDMLAPAEESRRIEAERARDPYLLTSRVFAMGTLLTEGDHLHLDRTGDWPAALALLLDAARARARESGAGLLVLRDLPARDAELGGALGELGFAPAPLPPSMVIPLAAWPDAEAQLGALSKKRRWELRRKVLRYGPLFSLEVLRGGGPLPERTLLEHCYRLYRNVKDRGLELNTFPLPERVFEEMLRHPEWELLLLRLRPDAVAEAPPEPVAVGACFVGPEQYVPVVVGLDYRYVEPHGVYRQALWQAVGRARAHGARRVCFGMGAPTEKARLGAVPEPGLLYAQPLKAS